MTKPKKINKIQNKTSKKVEKQDYVSEELEKELEDTEEAIGKISAHEEHSQTQIISSKPISQIKKGDKIKVDSLTLEVDAHYVLIDHGSAKEMTIELFDPKTDKEYQLRYFLDQVETSMEFYELNEIIYNKKEIVKVVW